MIDYAFHSAKLILLIVGMLLMCGSIKRKSSSVTRFQLGVSMLLLMVFMSGVEMITDSDHPWAYLIYSGLRDDWEKAFFGGFFMITATIIIFSLSAKNISDNSDEI